MISMRNKEVYKANRKWFATASVIIIIVALFAMSPYIFGQANFVFKDLGTDSFGQTFPNHYFTANCIEQGVTNGFYNFYQGLGTPGGSISFSLGNWMDWFGKENVAYLMGIDYLLKLILSGIFFYGFLSVKGCENWYAIVLSLGYMFCGHMSVRSTWASYPFEVLLVAIWLLAFELWFQRGDYRWLPLATLIFLTYKGGAYNMILYGGLVVVYIFVRYFLERNLKWRYIFLAAGVILLLALGYLFATHFAISKQIMNMFDSIRMQNQMAVTEWSMDYFIPDRSIIPTVIFRTIAPCLNGNGVEYSGKWNMLGDPAYYCGMAAFLLLPLAFYSMKARERIVYGILYLGAFIYTFCYGIRLVANGMAEESYKLSSFWITILILLTVSRISISEMSIYKYRSISCILILFMLAFSIMEIYRFRGNIPVSARGYAKIVILFLVITSIAFVSLIILHENRVSNMIKALVILITIGEVICLTYPIYRNRQTGGQEDYMDDTVGAVQYIEARDNSFYRVDKQFLTWTETESLMQGYRGIKAYVGGLGIGDDFYRFYDSLNLIAETDYRIIYQPSAYNEVETLLGVKYILAKGDIANFGYEKIGEYGEVSIYENQYAVPMGFVYHNTISQKAFDSLTYKQKQRILLKAMISDDNELPMLSEDYFEEITAIDSLLNEYEVERTVKEGDYRYYFEPNGEDEVIAVRVHFPTDWGRCARIHYICTDDTEYEMEIIDLEGAGGQVFEINQPNVNRIWIESHYEFDDIQIACIPKSLYYDNYIQSVEQLRKEAVSIDVCEMNYMHGYVSAESAGMLFLPIINNGWTLILDGKNADLMSVNGAFVGTYIEKGTHELEFVCSQSTFLDKYAKRMGYLFICLAVIAEGTVLRKKKGVDRR